MPAGSTIKITSMDVDVDAANLSEFRRCTTDVHVDDCVKMELETTRVELQMVRSGQLPLRDRVGMKLSDKSNKQSIAEVASKWADATTGQIS